MPGTETLVNIDRLKKSLTNFDVRNLLMKELDLSDDKKRFYKLVLAFWLGSNSTLVKLKLENKFSVCGLSIYKGYYFLLTFDKYISLLIKESSTALALLQDCRLKIVKYFNQNYQLLDQDPEKIFSFFESIMQSMDEKRCHLAEHQSLLHEAKQQCLLDLSLQSSVDIETNYPPTKAFQKINDLFARDFFKQSTFSTLFNRILTGSFQPFPFYLCLPVYHCESHVHKMLLQANDGIIIEGLFVKKRQSFSENIVLALVGHFPSEHSYIANSVLQFHQLFGSDIVFIDHRNYSERSARFADSIERLVLDVICFVKHFKQQNKNIVLYGMCGGAAHMILAAEYLMKENIKFKLIVDRFSREYIHFMDRKTVSRGIELGFFEAPSASLEAFIQSPYKRNLLIPFHYSFIWMMKVLFMLSGTNYDFGNIIRTIPEQDLLILQAKSKKEKLQKEPAYTDIIVHPKNDIRGAVKEKRYTNKLILKNLSHQCNEISSDYSDFPYMQNIFKELADCFNKGMKLIDSEKLTFSHPYFIESKPASRKIRDLHGYYLFDLTTRDKIPIHRFVGGFFKQTKKSRKNLLAAFPLYPVSMIFESLQVLHGDSKREILAQQLHHFLTTLSEHSDYLFRLMNRLVNTGLEDINLPLQKLMDSELFKMLSQNQTKCFPHISNF